MFAAQTFPEGSIITRNSFAPRLGVSYDVTGKGSTVLKGFYGRYYYNYADTFSSLNPAGANYKTFKFNDVNNNGTTTARRNSAQFQASAGGTTTKADPNMKKPYADESDVSVEHQFWGESSVRVAYVRKNTYNEYTTVDLARVGNFTVPTQVTVQVRDFVNGVTGTQTLNLMDLAPGARAGNTITNVPDGHSSTTRCSSPSTSASARVCSSRPATTTSGATSCAAAARQATPRPAATRWRTRRRARSTRTCSRSGSSTTPYPTVSQPAGEHELAGSPIGRYLFKWRHRRAANFRIQSGYAYARVWTGTLPRAGTFRVFSENIENNRTDTASILDFRADKAFHVGRYRFTAMADLFNAANSNAVTNFVLINGANYNKINATLDPRTFQVGLRFDF